MRVLYDTVGFRDVPLTAQYDKPMNEMRLTTGVDGRLEIPAKLKSAFYMSAAYKHVNETGERKIHYTKMTFKAGKGP